MPAHVVHEGVSHQVAQVALPGPAASIQEGEGLGQGLLHLLVQLLLPDPQLK